MYQNQKWVQIVDTIFKKKAEYKKWSDIDKDDSFYIINKKFYLGKPEMAQFFNHKYIDKSSAMDLWFLRFGKTHSQPGWYWVKSKNKKDSKKKVPKADKEMFMDYEQLTEKEFEFLYEHYKDDVDYKIKLLKRLDG